MFGSLGVPEILFLLVIALLVFGPKRLPEVGRTLGKGLSEFRRASNELKRSIATELDPPEEPRVRTGPGTAASSVPQASPESLAPAPPADAPRDTEPVRHDPA
jgi:TatA/E family protein of Tat protein translocase